MSELSDRKDPCKGKVRFGSYDAAALALVDCKIKATFRGRGQKRREQKVYYCGDCYGFHLTSRPERRSA